jgi:hypothetical protein
VPLGESLGPASARVRTPDPGTYAVGAPFITPLKGPATYRGAFGVSWGPYD